MPCIDATQMNDHMQFGSQTFCQLEQVSATKEVFVVLQVVGLSIVMICSETRKSYIFRVLLTSILISVRACASRKCPSLLHSFVRTVLNSRYDSGTSRTWQHNCKQMQKNILNYSQ